MAETFTLTNVWELQLVLCGDQGGCVGSWVGYFESEAAATNYFDSLCLERPGDDWSIYKEGQKKAMISDKKTLYVLGHGPSVLTPSK